MPKVNGSGMSEATFWTKMTAFIFLCLIVGEKGYPICMSVRALDNQSRAFVCSTFLHSLTLVQMATNKCTQMDYQAFSHSRACG